ncbi:MAG: methyltransferase domain-containing protein [Gemmataceae bacterium]|nr:methyltransferase domain-containing protein [Gemmataceae bacterium]
MNELAETRAVERYESERRFFDRLAADVVIEPMSRAALERYARPPRPHLFSKEFMFSLLGDARGKRVLEVGCGQGVASVQLAYCGARVTGIDLSEESVHVARRRAAVQGLPAEFRVVNVEADDLGLACYDVVWCDLILHHLVHALDAVAARLFAALRPGGLFLAREPIAYAGWLQALRRLVPVRREATPDEQPLRRRDFALLEKHFGRLHYRYFRLFARIDRLTKKMPVLATAARLDNLLLALPGAKRLAGNAVVWARKP